jgi:hypothetical protein
MGKRQLVVGAIQWISNDHSLCPFIDPGHHKSALQHGSVIPQVLMT